MEVHLPPESESEFEFDLAAAAAGIVGAVAVPVAFVDVVEGTDFVASASSETFEECAEGCAWACR